LQGPAKWAATVYALSVFLLSFGIPFLQLIIWSWDIWAEIKSNFVQFLVNSLLLSTMAAALICILALLLSYSQRRHPRRIIPVVVRVATLGYALPGTVLAVALVIFINLADEWFVNLLRLVGINLEVVFQGTVLTMLLAYAVRFMAAGFNPTQSALQRITGSIDEAARSLGVTGFKAIRTIHVPVIRKGLLTAAILVFVDVMKEMPITLMTRPFGWDTLAVKIYELTSEGEWQTAALPAVVLIVAGIIPVIFLTRQIEKI
jgi:iron(III) transport system permease protein